LKAVSNRSFYPMGFLSNIFGTDSKTEKQNKFQEFETKWASDPEILMMSKTGWLGARGNHSIQKNHLDEAINDFKEILELNPENVNAYRALVGVYAAKKDYVNAMKSLSDCKKMIDQSKDEEVKIQIVDFYFLAGSLELELSDLEQEGQRRLARQEGVAQAFYMFLKEEKIVAQNPIWQELLGGDKLMRVNGLAGDTGSKNLSLKDQHEEKVKFAKEVLTKLMVGMKPETQEMVSRVLMEDSPTV